MFSYCDNEPIDNSDVLGWGAWVPVLTLADYKIIHDTVADRVALTLGWWRASREVYVKGWKGRGFLDVYDTISNEYYEVKSIGAAYKASTERQMQKYDVAKPPLSWADHVRRGSQKVSGSFYYGAWRVSYALEKKGLVVYRPTWKQEKYNMYVAALALAFVIITATVLLTGGATAPAYTLLFF